MIILVTILIFVILSIMLYQQEKVEVKNINGDILLYNVKDSLECILDKPYGTYIYTIYSKKIFEKEYTKKSEKKVEYSKDTYAIFARSRYMPKGVFIPYKCIIKCNKNKIYENVNGKIIEYKDLINYPYGEYEVKIYLKNPYNNVEFYEDTRYILHTEVTKKEYYKNEKDIEDICSGDYYKLLHNVNIKGKYNVDKVFLHKTGIYLIYTINKKGKIKGISTDRFWYVINNDNKERVYNPILQSKSHIDGLNKILKLEENRLVTTIIVLDNESYLENFNKNLENIYIINEKDLKKTLLNIFSRNLSFLSVKDIDNMYKNLEKYSKI